MNRAQQKSLAGLALVGLLLTLLWWSNGLGQDTGSERDSRETTSQTSESGELPTVEVDKLPPEAHETIALIEQGGPFPYGEDGSVFQNRERLLPQHPRGYYREYTVETPGSEDRGGRRIVTGGDTMYWTADHYSSFARIVGVD